MTGQSTLGAVQAQAVNAASLSTSANITAGGILSAQFIQVQGGNIQLPLGQSMGVNLNDAFTFENVLVGWYSLGWFKDSWFPYGATTWFSGYGGFKFFTGAMSPAFSIDYSGHCVYYNSLQKASSISLKDNISALSSDEASEVLNALEPVKYNRKAAPDERVHLGFVAEHVHQSVASADRKSIIPDEIVAVLTRVLKDQQETIRNLAKKVADLEAGHRPHSETETPQKPHND